MRNLGLTGSSIERIAIHQLATRLAFVVQLRRCGFCRAASLFLLIFNSSYKSGEAFYSKGSWSYQRASSEAAVRQESALILQKKRLQYLRRQPL